MSKITIIKIYKQIEGLRLITLQELADYIRTGKYHETVDKFRKFYPLFVGTSTDRYGNLDVDSEIVRALPRICFALEQSNRNRERVTKAYTGLVLLEVNNLTSRDEAEAVRRGAAEMPQTLMTFVGAELPREPVRTGTADIQRTVRSHRRETGTAHRPCLPHEQ